MADEPAAERPKRQIRITTTMTALFAVAVIAAIVLGFWLNSADGSSADGRASDRGADDRAKQAAEAAAGAASATVPPPVPETSATPVLSPEQQALAEIGYTDVEDYTALSTLCAELASDDVYLSPDRTLSPEQITEVQGMLIVCPQHPLAAELRAAVARGQKHADQEAKGEIFYAGTYRVGKDIQPGTYAVEGDIEDCYWERTDASGEIIDNNFVAGAKRVQVIIAGSDYSFHTQGCGEWRKVS